MKVFTYEFDLSESGRTDYRKGIVVANSESEAKGLLLERYPNYMYQKIKTTVDRIELEEVNTEKIAINQLAFDAWEE